MVGPARSAYLTSNLFIRRRSAFVECMAVFADRGNAHCGPDISVVYALEAPRRSPSRFIRTRDV